MKIKNGKVFIGHNFVETDVEFDKKFTKIGVLDGKADIDAEGCYVIPGLVDIHTHGNMAEDFSDGKAEGIQTMANFYAAHGVTSFVGTTMTLKEPVLTPAMHVLRDWKRQGGAKCAGVHLEGPFVCKEKCGAQDPANLAKPDVALFNRLNEASGNQIRLITMAPEVEGSMPFIREVSKVCTISIGHTIADYDTAMEAFKNGASHATHLFNAMPGFLHRAPGVIGAALDSGASVEMICDGLHIHPAVIRATHKMFGDKLNLISDSLRCTGMPDGDYTLGGQPIEMKNHKATLKGSDTLAGSSITVLDAVRNVVKFGLSLEDAVYCGTTAPADAIRAKDIGRIEEGACADFLVLDKDLNLKAVYVDGEKVC